MPLVQRAEVYYLRRRVPARYARVESRREVWQTLKTDSREEALRKYPDVWESLLNAWEALLLGDAEAAAARFDSARNFAEARGVEFINADRVAKLPVGEILTRVELARGVKNTRFGVEAFLGSATPPPTTIKTALEMFFSISDDRVRGKSVDQLRRWRNPRIKAINNFAEVVGDKDIFEITRNDMLLFWRWWQDRIQNEGLSANSANKDIGHLSDILKTLKKIHQWDVDFPLGDLKFRDDGGEKRPPFSKGWIENKLLAPDALLTLNSQARYALLILVNTGARPSEITGLLPEHIVLSGTIPYVSIKPQGRQLKTRRSVRDIPLAGVSLEAAREAQEKTFPRYRNRDLFSATVNKFLRESGLMESERHTIYSLRHSFEDRLLRGRVDQRIRADLMGHSFERPEYGDGGGLVTKHEAILKIAL